MENETSADNFQVINKFTRKSNFAGLWSSISLTAGLYLCLYGEDKLTLLVGVIHIFLFFLNFSLREKFLFILKIVKNEDLI
jgi:hypothetical protein